MVPLFQSHCLNTAYIYKGRCTYFFMSPEAIVYSAIYKFIEVFNKGTCPMFIRAKNFSALFPTLQVTKDMYSIKDPYNTLHFHIFVAACKRC